RRVRRRRERPSIPRHSVEGWDATAWFFYGLADLAGLHSFPTRRSSDLFDHLVSTAGTPPPNYPIGDADMDFVRSSVDNKLIGARSEEQRLNSSHVASSYAGFCLKKKTLPDLTSRCGAAAREPPYRGNGA